MHLINGFGHELFVARRTVQLECVELQAPLCDFKTMRESLELLPNRVDLSAGFLLVAVREIVGVCGDVVGSLFGIIEQQPVGQLALFFGPCFSGVYRFGSRICLRIVRENFALALRSQCCLTGKFLWARVRMIWAKLGKESMSINVSGWRTLVRAVNKTPGVEAA